jgi:transposase
VRTLLDYRYIRPDRSLLQRAEEHLVLEMETLVRVAVRLRPSEYSAFTTLALSTGQFVRMMCAIFNAATFQDFLRRLLRQQTPGRRMILILDNARYHHAILLAPFLRRHARHLRLLFLPPYSSQLAPIERVWKLTRRLATHNHYFATLPDVLKAVNACFDRWRRPNNVLRRLCCIT